jgi:hypothetical protein
MAKIDIKEILKFQLKGEIENLHSIVKECSYGYPVAIQSLPFKKDKNGKSTPFPTTFWLTCPYLRRKIGELESKGYIKKAKEMLKDKETLYKFIKSREITIKERLSMVGKDFEYYDYISKLGIGGSRDDTKIKCLHLHVANFFKTKINPIGKWVLENIDSVECEDCECCKFINKGAKKSE